MERKKKSDLINDLWNNQSDKPPPQKMSAKSAFSAWCQSEEGVKQSGLALS